MPWSKCLDLKTCIKGSVSSKGIRETCLWDWWARDLQEVWLSSALRTQVVNVFRQSLLQVLVKESKNPQIYTALLGSRWKTDFHINLQVISEEQSQRAAQPWTNLEIWTNKQVEHWKKNCIYANMMKWTSSLYKGEIMMFLTRQMSERNGTDCSITDDIIQHYYRLHQSSWINIQ